MRIIRRRTRPHQRKFSNRPTAANNGPILTGGQEVTDGGEQVEKRQLFGMYAINQETIDDTLAMHTDHFQL
jgi:hypothetical protein